MDGMVGWEWRRTVKVRGVGTLPVEWALPVEWGTSKSLPAMALDWVLDMAALLRPRALWLCDGSEEEKGILQQRLLQDGLLRQLPARPGLYLASTHPHDADSASRIPTRVVAPDEETAQLPLISPQPWMSEEEAEKEVAARFSGAMRGRVLYAVPFSLGPVDGATSLSGLQLTDSPFTVLSTHLLARVSGQSLADGGRLFVRCVHSLGLPLPSPLLPASWECNPKSPIVIHMPRERRVWSFGSGNVLNSVLSKEHLSLRMASWLGHEEGWFAVQMAVFSVTREADGVRRYFGAAFPSGCGKTSLALMTPLKKGFIITPLGDDVAWLRWDPSIGRLCASCPSNGFYGRVPSLNDPAVLAMLKQGGILTNIAETERGDFFWEGLEDLVGKVPAVTDWRGVKRKQPVQPSDPLAHPDARFTLPHSHCSIRHPQLGRESRGVPLDAILFGSRRPDKFPLIYESSNLVYEGLYNHDEDLCSPWIRGAYIGASLRSWSPDTQSLEVEPFAMGRHVSYDLGRLCNDWLRLVENKETESGMAGVPPRVYHVNWFREDRETGTLLWPGFGENVRVLEWVMKRLDEGPELSGQETETGEASLLGIVPRLNSLDLSGMEPVPDWEALMSQSWAKLGVDVDAVTAFFMAKGGRHFPHRLTFCAASHLTPGMDLDTFLAGLGLPAATSSDAFFGLRPLAANALSVSSYPFSYPSASSSYPSSP